jgi:hypothetical protein
MTFILALVLSVGTLLLLITVIILRHFYLQKVLSKLIPSLATTTIKDDVTCTKANDLSIDLTSSIVHEELLKSNSKCYLRPATNASTKSSNKVTNRSKKNKDMLMVRNQLKQESSTNFSNGTSDQNCVIRQSTAPVNKNVNHNSAEIISEPAEIGEPKHHSNGSVKMSSEPESVETKILPNTVSDFHTSNQPKQLSIVPRKKEEQEDTDTMPYKIEICEADKIEEDKTGANSSYFIKICNALTSQSNAKEDHDDAPKVSAFSNIETINHADHADVEDYHSEKESAYDGIECIYDANQLPHAGKKINTKSPIDLDKIIDRHIIKSTMGPSKATDERDGYDFV